MLGKITIAILTLVTWGTAAFGEESAQAISRPIDERIQIVGTIAQQQQQSGQAQGVVILRDNETSKTIFAELGKAFLIDDVAFRIARVDYQGAVITNGRQRYDVSYINPPSASSNTEALVYDADQDAKPEKFEIEDNAEDSNSSDSLKQESEYIQTSEPTNSAQTAPTSESSATTTSDTSNNEVEPIRLDDEIESIDQIDAEGAGETEPSQEQESDDGY